MRKYHCELWITKPDEFLIEADSIEEAKDLCQNGWGLILEKRAEVLEMERMTAKKKAQERDEWEREVE